MLQFLIARPAGSRRLPRARCVAPHLQANENFDVAGVPAGLGRGNTTLAKRERKLRPLFFKLVTRTFFVGEALPQARIQAQAVAHLRRRATPGLDVESWNTLGDQQRAPEREEHR